MHMVFGARMRGEGLFERREFSWDGFVGDTLCRWRGSVALIVDCSKPFNSVFT